MSPSWSYGVGAEWVVKQHVHRLNFCNVVFDFRARGGHSIVKLNTTCGQKKFTFGKLHHQNESKFYQFFFMSRYTWYLLHIRKLFFK